MSRMTIRNNQYISLNKTEKNTEAARFHFSKEMVVAIVTCAIALIALLPINEVLTTCCCAPWMFRMRTGRF